jgi:hypothetical protein
VPLPRGKGSFLSPSLICQQSKKIAIPLANSISIELPLLQRELLCQKPTFHTLKIQNGSIECVQAVCTVVGPKTRSCGYGWVFYSPFLIEGLAKQVIITCEAGDKLVINKPVHFNSTVLTIKAPQSKLRITAQISGAKKIHLGGDLKSYVSFDAGCVIIADALIRVCRKSLSISSAFRIRSPIVSACVGILSLERDNGVPFNFLPPLPRWDLKSVFKILVEEDMVYVKGDAPWVRRILRTNHDNSVLLNERRYLYRGNNLRYREYYFIDG